MDFSHFAEIPLATYALGALSVVILVAIASAKFVFIAVLARWVWKGGGRRRMN